MRDTSPGRPPLPAARRRCVRVTLSFTPNEAAVLLTAASEAGFRFPGGAPALRLYLLALIGEKHPALNKPSPSPDPLVIRLRRELRALSNNLHQAGSRLNQAVKLWHGSRSAEPPSYLAPILRELPLALDAVAVTYRALLGRK